MSLLASSVPDISRQFLDKLRKAFPPLKPKPNITSIEELMYNSGQQELIDWIEHHSNKEMIVTGSME